ncbi:beta-propeller repeat protein [Leptospira ryugenii]|uniref:Beta-propeller repeat protein n=2 Tax=Leptospira ryugenii TaxID=1917863 RepID=A0A2P2DVI7_9LEPT|nr:beta-propeller repeat protein [Leptospira ryugenii]
MYGDLFFILGSLSLQLSYSNDIITMNKDQTVRVVPTVLNRSFFCRTESAFPPGLSFDGISCSIFGVPTKKQNSSPVTITAQNFTTAVSSQANLVVFSTAIGDKEWTRQLGVAGSFQTFSQGIHADRFGNVYVGGHTTGALDGQGKANDSGNNDAVLVKFNAEGTKQWTRQFGSSGNNFTLALGVVTASLGNTYLVGRTTGALESETKISNAMTNTDGFLTKYDSLGNRLWTRLFGVSGAFNTEARGVATDSLENAYVVGYTNGSLNGQTKTSSAASFDGFFVKYDSNGNLVYTKQTGVSGSNSTFAIGIAVDLLGNVYITGNTAGSLDGQTKTSDIGKTDAFLAKYDNNGNRLWTRQFGSLGNNSTDVRMVRTDSDNNIYLVGYTEGTLDSQTKISGAGYYDGFLMKFDSDGNRKWTRQVGGNGSTHTYGRGVSIDSAGNVYASGETYGQIGDDAKVSSQNDAYLIKYDKNGSRLWVRQLGTAGAFFTLSIGVIVDPSGNVYSSGSATGSLDGQTKVSSSTFNELFVTKYQ